jgi:hypothetical protein
MKTLQFTTTPTPFPQGIVLTDYYAEARNANGDVVFQAEGTLPQFPWDTALPIGTYQVTCQARGPNRTPIGAMFSGQVVWNDTVQIAMPSGVAIVDL